jgi:hypothetical protein
MAYGVRLPWVPEASNHIAITGARFGGDRTRLPTRGVPPSPWCQADGRRSARVPMLARRRSREQPRLRQTRASTWVPRTIGRPVAGRWRLLVRRRPTFRPFWRRADWHAAARAEAKGVVERWNEQLAASRDMLWSPTIRAALIAGTPWLDVFCPSCGTSRAIDLRKVDRHPLASVATLVLGLRCSWCPESAPMPRILGLHALPPAAKAAASNL